MALAEDVKVLADNLNRWESNFKSQLTELLRTLANNPMGYSSAYQAFITKVHTEIGTIVQGLNNAIKAPQTTQTGTGAIAGTAAKEIETFIKFANYLDEQGAHALADQVTELARLFKSTESQKKEEITQVQAPVEGSLSTRYCPDHCGVPTIRISDRIAQCAIDGKIYDYEAGYVNYKGQRVPGGSISEQTPSQSDCGGIPMRTYEPTANILNRDN